MTATAILHPAKHPTLEERIAQCASGGLAAINERLEQLDGEWSAGRAVKVINGVVIVAGLLLAAYHDPAWLLLPLLSGAFLLQYCFFKRSLLAEAFQAMGFRSGCAIDDEKLLLRALRGDFRNLPTMHEVEDKEAVHRMEDEGGPVSELEDSRFDPKEAAAIIVTATR